MSCELMLAMRQWKQHSYIIVGSISSSREQQVSFLKPVQYQLNKSLLRSGHKVELWRLRASAALTDTEIQGILGTAFMEITGVSR